MHLLSLKFNLKQQIKKRTIRSKNSIRVVVHIDSRSPPAGRHISLGKHRLIPATPLCKPTLSRVIFRYYPVLRGSGGVNQIYGIFIHALKFYQRDFFPFHCPVQPCHPLLTLEWAYFALFYLLSVIIKRIFLTVIRFHSECIWYNFRRTISLYKNVVLLKYNFVRCLSGT